MQRLRITSAGIQTHIYSSAILLVLGHPGHTQFGFLHTVETGGFRDTDMVKLHAYDRI